MASQATERKLRDTLCSEGENAVVSEEMLSLSAALWFQCMVALQIEFTMAAFDRGQGYEESLLVCSRKFARIFREQRRLTKTEIHESLTPLCRFVSAFPPKDEVGSGLDTNCFAVHPRLEGSCAITPHGLRSLGLFCRAFWLRRRHLRNFEWEPEAHGRPATEDETNRALEVSLGRADSRATDKLLDEARHRTIGRIMPPHGLYNPAVANHLESKDLYLVMREIDPDNLNGAHRSGSVPVLLSLESKERTVHQEIMATLILLASDSIDLQDETYGSRVTPSHKGPCPGYYCGEYVHILPNGKFRHGFGSGLSGAIGCLLPILNSIDKLGYNFIKGSSVSFKPTLHEEEYETANCF